MAMIPENYTNAVVSIGIRIKDNKIAWVGTGFFMVRAIDEDHGRLFLVTNRHVLEDKSTVVIRMKERGTETLKEIDLPIVDANDGSPLYKVHPNDKIDIAVLPIDDSVITENNLEYPAFDVDAHAKTSTELMALGVESGSLVYMLGFPMGYVNQTSNAPICRLGCVARLSTAQIQEEHNILLDIQNFPGNSGSPVVSRPEFVSIEGTPTLDDCVLMGIVCSYIPYNKFLADNQKKKIVQVQTENSGIAIMHPVEYIREIIDEIQPQYQPA